MYKLRIYKKDLEYSYALGVFPVLELLKRNDVLIDQVLIAPNRIEDSNVQEIQRICKSKNIPIVVNEHKIRLLAPKENTYTIAVFKKAYKQLNAKLPHVVLVSPSNLGNIGMIVRSMVAFGFNDLAIIKPAVDIYDPKVIASSVGSIFQNRIQYFNSLSEYKATFAQAQIERQLYTFTLNTQNDLRMIDFSSAKDGSATKTFSLVFGNEAKGLSESDAKLGTQVFIPQTNKIDSLNLANAVAIVLWEAVRLN
jgi:TrmH family RNA methyltransferase